MEAQQRSGDGRGVEAGHGENGAAKVVPPSALVAAVRWSFVPHRAELRAFTYTPPPVVSATDSSAGNAEVARSTSACAPRAQVSPPSSLTYS